MDNKIPDTSSADRNCWARWALIAFGWLNVVIAIIGIAVPGLPTTVFLIIAFWAFSNSSERFQTWIWNHPRFGPSIRDWHEYRVIPLRAKILAVSMMSLSFSYLVIYIAEDFVLPMIMAMIMIPAGVYVVTRDSKRPESCEEPVAVCMRNNSTKR